MTKKDTCEDCSHFCCCGYKTYICDRNGMQVHYQDTCPLFTER